MDQKLKLDEILSDPMKRELFIEKYIPFIINSVAKTTKRYISTENDEEFSIGLMAFNEAIEKFKPGKGNFFTFAELIIRNRLIDYIRKQQKKIETTSMEGVTIISKDNIQDSFILKEELQTFICKLQRFGITLEILIDKTPKQLDIRKKCISIARLITENKEMLDSFYRKKKLPSTRLHREWLYSVKFMKRHRSYIIASIIIYDSNLESLKAYLSNMEVN